MTQRQELFFPLPLQLQIEQSHGRALVGQYWLVCLPVSGSIMLVWGMGTDSSVVSFPCRSLWLAALSKAQKNRRQYWTKEKQLMFTL